MCAVVSIPAFAQHDDLKLHLKASQDLRGRGDFAAAETEARKYEQAVKARFGGDQPWTPLELCIDSNESPARLKQFMSGP